MRRGLNQVSPISLRRKGLNQVSPISLRRRGLNQVSPISLRRRGFAIASPKAMGPSYLGENGPSSLVDMWLLGECAQVPQETWFPIANGLKFLWKTCFFGSLEQMGLSSPKETCQGNLSPFALKMFWADVPQATTFP